MNNLDRSFIRDLRKRGIHQQTVLEAMERVPRNAFVLAQYVCHAYGDYPLPIGYGQTISQPYMVAAMTQLLHVEGIYRVLEIGTGCGYQTAILAELGADVYTVERITPLCEQARRRLDRLGYDRVHLRCGDGYEGWAEHAPFDGIIVTCAPDHIPPALLDQLGEGGRMVIPVGPAGQNQVLWLVEREGDQINRSRQMGVSFVPLVRSQVQDMD